LKWIEIRLRSMKKGSEVEVNGEVRCGADAGVIVVTGQL
jgi:hypothetical protein